MVSRCLLGLLVLYVLGTALGGIGLGWITLHPPRRPITEREEQTARSLAARNLEGFQDVELSTPDGTILRGWFIQPQHSNQNVVILLHGVSDNRLGMYGYGQWLLQHNYAVLLPDARAHGLSGGLASFGLNESDDVHRWMDWVQRTTHPRCVFGMGESMGAAQLLQALSKESRFCAVVAESPFATFREVAYARFGREFHTGPWLGRSIFRPTVDVGFLYVRLRYALDMEKASPEQAILGTSTPILLIHGLKDRNIPPYHSDRIQSMNPSDIAVWKVPGATHTAAHKTSPTDFEAKVLEWFDEHSRNAN